MANLKRAMGTLSNGDFAAAVGLHTRMEAEHISVARAFLVRPGRLQLLIAEDSGISKKLVHRHCKKLYETHCNLKKMR